MIIKSHKRGSVNILVLFIIIFICIFLIIIFDCSIIFIKREKTENIAEMISLAVSQELLFFKNYESDILNILAAQEEILKNYEIKIKISEDEVEVSATTPLNLMFMGKTLNKNNITSTAITKILYPWDETFDFCKKYKFQF